MSFNYFTDPLYYGFLITISCRGAVEFVNGKEPVERDQYLFVFCQVSGPGPLNRDIFKQLLKCCFVRGLIVHRLKNFFKRHERVTGDLKIAVGTCDEIVGSVFETEKTESFGKFHAGACP